MLMTEPPVAEEDRWEFEGYESREAYDEAKRALEAATEAAGLRRKIFASVENK